MHLRLPVYTCDIPVPGYIRADAGSAASPLTQWTAPAAVDTSGLLANGRKTHDSGRRCMTVDQVQPAMSSHTLERFSP